MTSGLMDGLTEVAALAEAHDIPFEQALDIWRAACEVPDVAPSSDGVVIFVDFPRAKRCRQLHGRL